MKRPRFPRLSKRWLVLPPIALGAAIVAFAVLNKQPLQQRPPREIARSLPVAVVSADAVRPAVTAYGIAQPARVWRAVARVDGAVTKTHPALDAGQLVAAGETLLEIDRTDYELTVGRLDAETDSLQAQIDETEQQRENDEQTLKIEAKSLELANAELARFRRMRERGAVTQSEVDGQTRTVLQQARTVQSLKSSLALAPAKLARLRASLAAAEKNLAEAERDLDRTVVTAPFDARVAEVSIEEGQYLAPNEPLFELHGTQRCEIEVRLAPDETQKLLPPSPGERGGSLSERLAGLPATVRVRSGDWTRQWEGEVVRIRELVDRRTRTLGLIVSVPDPSAGETPLLEGTFAEVEIVGPPRTDVLTVPAAAFRQGAVYVVDDENRLRRRAASLAFRLGDRVAVRGDLAPGERVVVGDAAPSVEGSLVRLPDASDLPPSNTEPDGTEHPRFIAVGENR